MAPSRIASSAAAATSVGKDLYQPQRLADFSWLRAFIWPKSANASIVSFRRNANQEQLLESDSQPARLRADTVWTRNAALYQGLFIPLQTIEDTLIS
jgi:hypothetical protein